MSNTRYQVTVTQDEAELIVRILSRSFAQRGDRDRKMLGPLIDEFDAVANHDMLVRAAQNLARLQEALNHA